MQQPLARRAGNVDSEETLMSREKYDWTIFTNFRDAMGIYGNTVRNSLASDSYRGKIRFMARALTDMFELDPVANMAIDGGSSGNLGNSRWAFKARIIGDNSPHSFLPDPCDPSYDGDQNQTYRIIAMHTTFISSTANKGETVTRGDVVVVEVDRSGFSYELEYGRFISISSHEKPAAATECSSLIKLAGYGAGPPTTTTRLTAGTSVEHGSPYTAAECNDASVPQTKQFSGKLTIEQGRILAKALAPLLAFIAKYESGGAAEDAVNYYSGGDYPSSTGTKRLGRNLQTFTPRQLDSYQKQRKVFAVGLYQQTTGPLRSGASYFGLLDKPFTIENQGIIAMANIFNKTGREALANYLLGYHNNKCMAGNALAYEWAFAGIQSDNTQSHLSYYRKNYSKCKRGSTAYCGTPNKAHATPEQVMAAIDAGKQGIISNSDALAAIRIFSPSSPLV